MCAAHAPCGSFGEHAEVVPVPLEGSTTGERGCLSGHQIDILLAQHTATGASEKILSSGQGAALSSPGISEN